MLADLITILNIVLGAFIVICWISVLVTMIRNRDVMGSLLAIIPVTAFVVGWLSVRRYKLRVLMIAWTGAIAIDRLLSHYFPDLMA